MASIVQYQNYKYFFTFYVILHKTLNIPKTEEQRHSHFEILRGLGKLGRVKQLKYGKKKVELNNDSISSGIFLLGEERESPTLEQRIFVI